MNLDLWDNEDGTYDVLDGKQRITVIRLYKNPNYLKFDRNIRYIEERDPDLREKPYRSV